MAEHTEARRGPEPPDLAERGGIKNGQPQRSSDRLFMQFLAFGGCADAAPLADVLARAKISGVLYEDLNDPRGAGLLTFSDDPDFFVFIDNFNGRPLRTKSAQQGAVEVPEEVIEKTIDLPVQAENGAGIFGRAWAGHVPAVAPPGCKAPYIHVVLL